MAEIAEIFEATKDMLLCLGILAVIVLVPLLKMYQWLSPAITAATLNIREQGTKAIQERLAKAGARKITVTHVGMVNTYLEHFTVNYYSDKNGWQMRHVIMRQALGETLTHDEQYFWDDPIVAYKREVSAEISQSKQNLINDLDVEIHELQQAIVLAKNSKSLTDSA